MWLMMLALFAAGACWVLTLSTFNATVQLSAPRWVVGRALALYQMATFGGMAGGSWLWGWLTLHFGMEQALLAAAATLVIGVRRSGIRSPRSRRPCRCRSSATATCSSRTRFTITSRDPGAWRS